MSRIQFDLLSREEVDTPRSRGDGGASGDAPLTPQSREEADTPLSRGDGGRVQMPPCPPIPRGEE